MKINWKVRLRNPIFWLTAIPSAVTMVYSVLGLFGVVPTVTEDVTSNVLATAVSLLTTLGVLIDPTTKGTCDSEKAMTYETPQE